jgi:hypothetical protein
MTSKFTGSGISEESIENYEENKEMIKSLGCCICLDIVKSPFQCETCESLYCEDCWEVMKISGKKCVINCVAPVKKANQFVFQMLNKLKIRCDTCGKNGIEYDMYLKHIEACLINKKISSTVELYRVVKEKEVKIDELSAELQNLKLNGNKTLSFVPENLTKEQIRSRLMTFGLSVQQKMQLYTCAVEGKLSEFKDLVVNKKYPALEEVSAHEYYWTSLHYAMHYGQQDIIFFILDHLSTNNSIDLIMKLQSNDNRCPLLCLLRSNSLSLDKKKDIIGKILSKYEFSISSEVKNEMRNRDMENILKKYNR